MFAINNTPVRQQSVYFGHTVKRKPCDPGKVLFTTSKKGELSVIERLELCIAGFLNKISEPTISTSKNHSVTELKTLDAKIVKRLYRQNLFEAIFARILEKVIKR